MIAALNRPHDLKLHVRGAINNGLTRNEIEEVFLQPAMHCGVPTATDATHRARRVQGDGDLSEDERHPRAPGIRLSGRRAVQRSSGADKRLEGILINGITFMDIDRAPGVAFQAGVEES